MMQPIRFVVSHEAHEEGRIRPKKINATQALRAANTKYFYDYFMKDQLGNIRMVLITEKQTDFYAATSLTSILKSEMSFLLFLAIDKGR